ncbi:methylenetetrahydrofolate reductase [Paenibacillus albus]|uniref:Methylenetetrahydrofolate reductase n=1 Tax=Paenibacillus albus TaxID=2495582 RepID=A0A3S9A7V2_9BACL|nr:methylenetetrahydrofolate reductase [Paenibacillus albus]AZN41837.1 5,10-methylenetetrahydrofolate reductase [Paenibacillus albus]
MLRDKLLARKPGIISYGMTPPKAANTSEKIAEIAQKQCERLRDLELDALILYDVQEEADRIEQERPFPYLQTVSPDTYSKQYLSGLDVPKIIYNCVGNHSEAEFTDWATKDADQDRYSVFVGSSSNKQHVHLGLKDAYQLTKQLNRNLTFGGVIIPERHMTKQDEHLRVVSKMKNGCDFFVTQAIYNVEASKNFLSDYYYYCSENGIEMVPILFNLAPCGSTKTLEFMKWLGISIPKWLENDLKYSSDVLDQSIRHCQKIFEEIFEYGLEKGIPIGCSIESVSTRKVEIDASVELVQNIKALLKTKLESTLV